MFDDKKFVDPRIIWDDSRPTIGLYFQDPMFLCVTQGSYAPDYASHHKPVRFYDNVDKDYVDPKFEGGLADKDYVNRSLAGPVKRITKWRDGTGETHDISQMDTSHIINCVRMLWRLNYGADARQEPYREEYIGPLSLELKVRNCLDQLGPEILHRTRFVYLIRQAQNAK